MGSALKGVPINCQVTPHMNHQPSELRRIYFRDYNPTDTESPQDSMSSITHTTLFDRATDEFKYQRIEADWVFGPFVKAESSHLMSHEHCRTHESYLKFDKDPSNRLALSREMHGFYDALSSELPILNIRPVFVSDKPEIEGRYKVELLVEVINAEYAQTVRNRLKDGSTVTDNPLIFKTYVYVLNPSIFKQCINWKAKQIDKAWSDYYSMTPAVD